MTSKQHGGEGADRCTLAVALTNNLRGKIENGEFAPGEKLPSEKALVESAHVSRTVVRESIAALRAEGLITVRHGVGIFVSHDAGGRKFRISAHDVVSQRHARDVLELRMGVEVEMAGLAALRRSGGQLESLKAALGACEARLKAGDAAAWEDFAFHVAIAEASDNIYFRQFTAFWGGDPGPARAAGERRAMGVPPYSAALHEQHRRIAEAIAAQDAVRARDAARAHMESCLALHAGPLDGPSGCRE